MQKFCPPGDPDYCRGNSCGGGGCRAASRNFCKEACAAYFDPAPDGAVAVTKECGEDGAWQDVTCELTVELLPCEPGIDLMTVLSLQMCKYIQLPR